MSDTRQSNSRPGPFLVEWEVIDADESRVRQEATVATLAEAAERIRILEIEGYGESASVWDADGRLVPHMDYQGHVTQQEFSTYEAMQGDPTEGSR